MINETIHKIQGRHAGHQVVRRSSQAPQNLLFHSYILGEAFETLPGCGQLQNLAYTTHPTELSHSFIHHHLMSGGNPDPVLQSCILHMISHSTKTQNNKKIYTISHPVDNSEQDSILDYS